MKTYAEGWLLGMTLAVSTVSGWAGANPGIPFYGASGSITATPAFPVVGESTRIAVVVGNTGDAVATNIRVKVSFNDWGVTFAGWQEIETVTVAGPIPAGGNATVEVDHVFETRAHTCVEAIVVGADEDTDPGDNRGQINLEVIQAGETFSYGVPVRNNGDEPIEVAIVGRCAGKGGDPREQGACPGIDEKAVIEPGQEILVPVELDLSKVPLGEAIDYVVDAVDQKGNRNHVVLRVVRQSALRLKKQVLETLKDVKGEAPNKGLANRIETVARHVRHAVGSGDWADENHLERTGGARVFAQELAAVVQMLSILQSRVPGDWKQDLEDAIRKLVDADRILASGAMDEASGAALDESTAWLLRGDAARIDGQYPKAIEYYLKAWHSAGR